MVFDWDDFGADKIISDMCQSHDCRDKLEELKRINSSFKCTLFTIPAYMTLELAAWAHDNRNWVELAVHGVNHDSNYECEKMSYGVFNADMEVVLDTFPQSFVKGFKAPGWQISDDIYKWLKDNGWWVADQNYNTGRRPRELPAYLNNSGVFYAPKPIEMHDMALWSPIEAWHGHTWDCVGNGIYETFDEVAKLVKGAKSFKFVSEVLK